MKTVPATGRGVDVLVAALPYQAGLALAAVLARPLSASALGEDVARGRDCASPA